MAASPSRSYRCWTVIVLVGLLAGCATAPCDEFAPPHDRAPSQCPPKPAAAEPHPIPGEPSATAPRYCYATLGQVDCYAAIQPGHPGYLGTATPGPPPREKPADPER